MLKKIFVLFATILFVTQVSAIDKNKISLNQTFWGSWSIFNPVTKCAENYQFNVQEIERVLGVNPNDLITIIADLANS